ncbi:MAG: hypothetical protein WBE37_34025, partial [Bryobacteraceae bacterium]
GALVYITVGGVANQHPADMTPPLAVARGVRIAFLVGELVMDAMVATQNIGPPSNANVPQVAKKYSTHFGVL